ncbi:hypothetical protein HPB51_014727 [Rhipicephalus microplus]|uniref:Uncharacterized protein n=1 Tax=Rhipicephalus microplus TaxID=6941 RepID=A0A9J6DN86_RHIMP|nr:hypothetical protein HPB51_014727 [Rhipicephalus microplus]
MTRRSVFPPIVNAKGRHTASVGKEGGATAVTRACRADPPPSPLLIFVSLDDNEYSFWMYAMISVGSAFVIFVAVTVYLMW